RELAIVASPQALAGTQQGHRLKQVGLAGAVVTDQHNASCIELEGGAFVIAEIGELQLFNKKLLGGTAGELVHRAWNLPLALVPRSRRHIRRALSTSH